MGWKKSYVEKLISQGGSVGITPLIRIVEAYPEINAGWMLTGKGPMFTCPQPVVSDLVEAVVHLANLERFIPVMSQEEIVHFSTHLATVGGSTFPPETIKRWESALMERQNALNARFIKAQKRAGKKPPIT